MASVGRRVSHETGNIRTVPNVFEPNRNLRRTEAELLSANRAHHMNAGSVSSVNLNKQLRNDRHDRGGVHHGEDLPHQQLSGRGHDSEGGASEEVPRHAAECCHLFPGALVTFCC